VKALLDALRGGADLRTATEYAELSTKRVYQDMIRGQVEHDRVEAGEEPLAQEAESLAFWHAVRKAHAEAVVRSVAQIQKAANQGDWKAAAWWLENSQTDFSKKR